jgi:serine/threonine protein phosphatase 1
MKRHLAVGDIHGCHNALVTLLEFVAPGRNDTIVTLGDYVDRGPDSAAVIEFLIDLDKTNKLIPLRGNHEVMLLDSREQNSWFHAWLSYGGRETLNSYSLAADDAGSIDQIPEAHLDFLENRLLPHYECETHFFVHAHADEGKPLTDQADSSLYWRRYINPELHCSGKIMVCGHTAQRSGRPAHNNNSICIDTWAHGEGWLTCLDVGSGAVWQANEAGDKRQFMLDEVEKIASR